MMIASCGELKDLSPVFPVSKSLVTSKLFAQLINDKVSTGYSRTLSAR
jgi:hypothetical protein